MHLYGKMTWIPKCWVVFLTQWKADFLCFLAASHTWTSAGPAGVEEPLEWEAADSWAKSGFRCGRWWGDEAEEEQHMDACWPSFSFPSSFFSLHTFSSSSLCLSSSGSTQFLTSSGRVCRRHELNSFWVFWWLLIRFSHAALVLSGKSVELRAFYTKLQKPSVPSVQWFYSFAPNCHLLLFLHVFFFLFHH